MPRPKGENGNFGKGEGVSLSITSLFSLFSIKTYARGGVGEGDRLTHPSPIHPSPLMVIAPDKEARR